MSSIETLPELSNERPEAAGDWLIVMPEAAPKTAGGLYIPETARRSSARGVVLSVGPDAKRAAKGDRVLVEWQGWIQVEHPPIGTLAFVRDQYVMAAYRRADASA